MTQILFLAIVTYLVTITIGYWLDRRFRLPWMLTVVILGLIFSAFNLFQDVMKTETFSFLSWMGMLFFLFTIGLEINLNEMRRLGKTIIVSGFSLTLAEGFFLALFFYFFFPEFVSHSFFVALIAGVAFGTIGEVVLLAILEEFGLVSTKFGQLALGIGIFDDIFEISILALIVALPSFLSTSSSFGLGSSFKILFCLFGIFITTFLVGIFGKLLQKPIEKIPDTSFVFPFLIFLVMFSFLYFSSLLDKNLAVVAAIFSGIAIQNLFYPKKLIEKYKKPIYFVGNMFLGPFFFLSMGSKISLRALWANPWLILIIILISLATRIFFSILFFNKILGKKPAAVLGVGLCTKFSTSIVSENLLVTLGLIAQPLYSAIVAAYIIMKPIIIVVFSRGLVGVKKEIKPLLKE